jgi:hypothetical protein
MRSRIEWRAGDSGISEPMSSLEPTSGTGVASRWVAPAFLVLGVALVPWTILLALTLPARHGTHHYDVAWTGFDLGLAAALLATAVGAARQAPWLQGAAVAAATLLVCDAWFDVLSSISTRELLTALALALFVELPVAAACLFVAWHAEEAADRARRLASLARTSPIRRRRQSRPPLDSR